MNMNRILWGFMTIAALALLAGCGGGGGTSLMVDPDGSGPRGEERATQALIDALEKDRDDEEMRADTAERERDARPTQGALSAVNMTLNAVRSALELGTDADETAILGAISALERRNPADPEDPAIAQLRSALGLGSDATLAMILSSVMGLVAEDNRMEDPVAMKKATAIADPDGDMMLNENNATTAAEDDLNHTNRPGKGTATSDDFSTTAGAVDTRAVIAFGDSGTTTEYDRLGMEDDENTNEFEDMTEGMVDGFARNKYTRTVQEFTKDEVTVFDNRDDPKDVEYGTYYSNADAGDRDAVTSAAGGVLTLDGNDVAGHHDLFSASEFPRGEDQMFTHVDANPEADPPVAEERGGQTFDGTFNGVPGEFACTGTCTSGTDSMGRLDSLGGTWTFTPDEVEEDEDPHMIRGVDFDADYLAFGFWLQETTVRGSTTYSIGTFASGSMPFAGTNSATAVEALRGSATYSGPAAGMFVMKSDIDGDNKGPVATSAGKFTAETTLTANFGSMPTIKSTDFSISGTVDNFQLTNYDGSAVENDWSLDLNMARFATPTFDSGTGAIQSFASHTRAFSGSTGSADSQGRWEGDFYGAQVTDDAGTTSVNEATSGYPTGVAGEFIGHFETGHAIGAFGAELDQ